MPPKFYFSPNRKCDRCHGSGIRIRDDIGAVICSCIERLLKEDDHVGDEEVIILPALMKDYKCDGCMASISTINVYHDTNDGFFHHINCTSPTNTFCLEGKYHVRQK